MKQQRICNFSNELLKLMALRGISTYTELERKAHLETKLSGFINSGRALPVADLNKLCDTLGVGHDYFKPFLESILVFKLNEVGKTVGYVNDNKVMRPISPQEVKKPVQVTYNKYKTFKEPVSGTIKIPVKAKNEQLTGLKEELKKELNETDKVLKEIRQKKYKNLTPEERKIRLRANSKDYYEKNKEKILAKKKILRDEAKMAKKETEAKKEYNAKYYIESREKIRKRQNENNRKKALEKRLTEAKNTTEKKGGFFSWLRKK